MWEALTPHNAWPTLTRGSNWFAEVRDGALTEACHYVWSFKLGWHSGAHRTAAAAFSCAEHAARRRNTGWSAPSDL